MVSEPASASEEEKSPADEERLSDEVVPEEAVGAGFLRWLKALVTIAVVLLAVRAGGDVLYDPPSRFAHVGPFTREQNLMGATRAVATEWQSLQQAFPADKLDFHLVGDVHELALPRTFGDRLFGERRERALVFTLESEDGERRRFLALSDGESPLLYAAESVASRRTDGPAGVFVAIPQDEGFAALREALSAIQAEADDQDPIEYSAEDYTLFGPFAGGNRDWIQQQIMASPVLAHFIEALDGNRADASLSAPLFLVARPHDEGTIRGLYQPYFGAIMQPFSEDNRTATLGHELVHAYMDEVERDRPDKLTRAADYFEEAHPRLYGKVISELYNQLDRSGRAEEAIADIVGSLAAREIRTVDSALGFSSRSLAEIAEPIWTADVALLVRFEFLPECMDPKALDYDQREITFEYYELLDKECG